MDLRGGATSSGSKGGGWSGEFVVYGEGGGGVVVDEDPVARGGKEQGEGKVSQVIKGALSSGGGGVSR